MTEAGTELLKLAERCENAKDISEIEALCRKIHEVDPHSNVNGSCAGYLFSIYEAKRLIPEGCGYVLKSDENRVRVEVVMMATDQKIGFSALHPGHLAETKALCAAALRARAALKEPTS